MRRLIGLLLLLVVCFTATQARADRIDEKVDRVVENFRTYENYTFKYPDGSGIAHADLRRILLVSDGDSTVLDKGVALVNLLETRKRYSDRQYAVAATELNADIIWAAVGAPGVNTELLNNPIQWAIGKAKSKVTDTAVDTADFYLPGVATAYSFYGSYVDAVAKFKNIQKVIDAATERYANAHLNHLVDLYINSGLIDNPAKDNTVWKEWSEDLIDGNPVTLQNFIERDYPNERWFSVHAFCQSAWRLNEQFKNGEFSNDITRYETAVNARIKTYYGNRLSIANASVVEGTNKLGSRNISFPVTLSAALPYDVSVRYVTNSISATATLDYVSTVVGIPGKLTIKAGQKSGTISIKVWSDSTEEKDEQFRVTLSSPSGVLLGKTSSAIGTILDDDYAGKIFIGDVFLGEGNSGQKSAKFSVSLSQLPLHNIEVSYATKDGTATAGSDYNTTTGKLLFNTKKGSATISVPVLGDTTIEADETFSVKLAASGYNFEKSSGTATILNDDKPAPTPIPTFAPTPVPTATPTPTPSTSGKIAFSSNRDGNYEIYVMNADGSNQTRLTTNMASDYHPVFSPDGTKIAFMSERDGNEREIYMMNADGTSQTQLTNNIHPGYPIFSPDGGKIAFESYHNSNYDIYVMNADGTNQTLLINNYNDDTYPVFSPDGTKIAFVAHNYFQLDIYAISVDGTSQTRLTTNGNNTQPVFSPDGTKIAFVSWQDGNSEIYVMNTDGSNQTRLTTNTADDGLPIFSPDGTKIAFVSWQDDNGEICVMNTDGSNQVRLTISGNYDNDPAFSLDGTKIAFVSRRDGDSQIYVMNKDGTYQTRLTSSGSNDFPPCWAPGSVSSPTGVSSTPAARVKAPSKPSAPSS